MAKITSILADATDIYDDFKHIELNALVLTRYASPSKANLTRTEDYRDHYMSHETETVLDLVSEDLLGEIEEMKKKLEALRDNLAIYCFGDTEEIADPKIVENLKRLIE